MTADILPHNNSIPRYSYLFHRCAHSNAFLVKSAVCWYKELPVQGRECHKKCIYDDDPCIEAEYTPDEKDSTFAAQVNQEVSGYCKNDKTEVECPVVEGEQQAELEVGALRDGGLNYYGGCSGFIHRAPWERVFLTFYLDQ